MVHDHVESFACSQEKFKEIDLDGNGRISEVEFIEWWNGRHADKFSRKLHQQLSMTALDEVSRPYIPD